MLQNLITQMAVCGVMRASLLVVVVLFVERATSTELRYLIVRLFTYISAVEALLSSKRINEKAETVRLGQ